MISERQIFCLSCHLVVDNEKAGRIFRTGYYKCVMRLGVCIDCSELEQGAPNAFADNKTDDHFATELL